MNYELSWNEAKRQNNIKKHGVDFKIIVDFDWKTALILEDTRYDCGECRYQALGYVGDRLHVLAFTPRDSVVHIISLRKANHREVNAYEQQEN